MRILLVNINFHRKNEHALRNYKNIQVVQIYDINQINNIDLSEFDCVYSPALPIDVSKYPNTKFLFGPHFSVFPDHKIQSLNGHNFVYAQPSDWALNSWKMCNSMKNVRFAKLPFGVDAQVYNETKPTIPYWDERCGAYFHKDDEFEDKFNLFLSKLADYKPREYIMEQLSFDKCEERFIEIVNNI